MKPVIEYADLHNMIGPCMFNWLSLGGPTVDGFGAQLHLGLLS